MKTIAPRKVTTSCPNLLPGTIRDDYLKQGYLWQLTAPERTGTNAVVAVSAENTRTAAFTTIPVRHVEPYN